MVYEGGVGMKSKIREMTPEQIRKAGIDALVKSLGPAGMASFFQQFSLGEGDYTRDRHKWLTDKNIEELYEKIKRSRKKR
jgi:hypothetical protein